MYRRIWKPIATEVESKETLVVYDAGNLQGFLHPSLGWKLYEIVSRERFPDGTIQEICSEASDCKRKSSAS
jgi:hypothetical protein